VKARAQLCAVDLDISEREQVFVNRLQIKAPTKGTN